MLNGSVMRLHQGRLQRHQLHTLAVTPDGLVLVVSNVDAPSSYGLGEQWRMEGLVPIYSRRA